jgi:hypothetical protein
MDQVGSCVKKLRDNINEEDSVHYFFPPNWEEVITTAFQWMKNLVQLTAHQ